jgi:hypothetical protein
MKKKKKKKSVFYFSHSPPLEKGNKNKEEEVGRYRKQLTGFWQLVPAYSQQWSSGSAELPPGALNRTLSVSTFRLARPENRRPCPLYLGSSYRPVREWIKCLAVGTTAWTPKCYSHAK